MNRYVFAVVFSNGQEREISAEAEWEQDARREVWRGLSDAECNACESIECIDVQLPADPLAAAFRL